ncbi:MAG: hypothetical protein ACREVR_09915 [Burkholderiales bacterium]
MAILIETTMSNGSVSGKKPSEDPDDFSIVVGGPLYQLMRRSHLAGDALQLVQRRMLVLPLFAWLPLLLLSTLGGLAWGDAVKVPFLSDIEVHVRFLVALPLLILAEVAVHRRMRPVTRLLVERGLIPDTSRAKFDAAVASAWRLRNSVVAEVVLIAFVYLVGLLYLWPNFTLQVATWYATPESHGTERSLAGVWYAFVSLPLVQFILLRWYFRLFVWIRFLWQVTRGELSLIPTHPDRAGGLGFLSEAALAFAPLIAAHGALLAGAIATRIFFEGAQLTDFMFALGGLLAFLLVLALGPLLMFSPHLEAARRLGLREYGTVAERYVREFDHKWLRGGAPAGESLLGSADIQSLADLANSFEVVHRMRLVPFTSRTALQLVIVTLVPVAPLLLTVFSLEELLETLLKVVF